MKMNKKLYEVCTNLWFFSASNKVSKMSGGQEIREQTRSWLLTVIPTELLRKSPQNSCHSYPYLTHHLLQKICHCPCILTHSMNCQSESSCNLYLVKILDPCTVKKLRVSIIRMLFPANFSDYYVLVKKSRWILVSSCEYDHSWEMFVILHVEHETNSLISPL